MRDFGEEKFNREMIENIEHEKKSFEEEIKVFKLNVSVGITTETILKAREREETKSAEVQAGAGGDEAALCQDNLLKCMKTKIGLGKEHDSQNSLGGI